MTMGVDRHVAVTAIERIRDGRREHARDEVAIEEPLEIRVDGAAIAVTMRTPGEDEDLAAGFLAGEALIGGPADIVTIGPSPDLAANVVEVTTTTGLRRDPRAERSFRMTSSCGVCGKAALEHVELCGGPAGAVDPNSIPVELVLDVPATARAAQAAFARTGGLHATGLFESGGALTVLREDVGRHNAMDKAIGALLRDGRHPLTGMLACLSGRVGFELVQKAALAGLAGIVAVGAPTSLAVELAADRGLLLCGFARGGGFNVYANSAALRR